VRAANEVTRRGRELLALLCRELAARGVTLLEADTDGVYFSVPEGWTEADERRVVAETAALLPARIRLEYDGRYAAMLSHEPKNYALAPYDGPLILRGVAFRSSRAERFGEAFLRAALPPLLEGDLVAVRAAFVEAVARLRRREPPAADVATQVRLTKSPEEYRETRATRREPAYEALLASGRERWTAGERVRVYRVAGGRFALLPPDDGEGGAAAGPAADARDYDVEAYVRLLSETYASRLARALSPEVYAAVCAAPEQLELFPVRLEDARTVLTVLRPDLVEAG
jgi:DNA polymerase elongation subunit (family B)